MKKILFICSGNTCRSPIAQGLLEAAVKNDSELNGKVICRSCGLSAFLGDMAQPNAVEAAKELEADISNHRSIPFEPEMIENFDILLTMSKSHRDALKMRLPQCKDKTFMLSEYVDAVDCDVKDPYGCDIDAYRVCANDLNEKINKLVLKLKS